MGKKTIYITETDNNSYIVEMLLPVSQTFAFDMLYLALQKVAELIEDDSSYYKCQIKAIHTPEEGE